jgi:hypothetical protein
MTKLGFLVVPVLAAGLMAAGPADARGRGGAVAAGVIGGLAAGALIGAAAANAAPGPVYYDPAPVYAPRGRVIYEDDCHFERRRVWDGYGWRVRRVEVCY